MSLTTRLTGVRDTCRLPQLDDSATEPIHFQPVATLQIIVHRGSNLRWETIAEGETILSVFGAEGDALRTTDGDHLAHDIQQEYARPGMCAPATLVPLGSDL